MLEALQILKARDKRVQIIEELLKQGKVVLSLRVNYPGIEKDNVTTRKIVEIMDHVIENQWMIGKCHYVNNGEGPVCLYLIDNKSPILIKKKTIMIEEEHPLGRLVDIDVYDKSSKSISRGDLNVKPRSCMLCSQDAFICIKSQAHSVHDLIEHIKKVVRNYER